jgi:hypothetical protein
VPAGDRVSIAISGEAIPPDAARFEGMAGVGVVIPITPIRSYGSGVRRSAPGGCSSSPGRARSKTRSRSLQRRVS